MIFRFLQGLCNTPAIFRSPFVFLFVPSLLHAQPTTMQQPFKPAGVIAIAIDPAKPTSIPAHMVYQGKDATGADVYADEWVDIPSQEFANAADAQVGRSGNSDIASTFAGGGLSVSPASPSGQRITSAGSYLPDGLGTCRRASTTGYVNSGTVMSTNVSFSSCYSLLFNYYGSGWATQPVKSIRNGDCYSFTVWYDGTTTIYSRGSWTPNVTQCNDEPAYPIVQPNPMTAQQGREFLKDPPAASGETSLPKVPPAPMPKDQAERIIINNTTVVTSVVTSSTNVTNNYTTNISNVTTTNVRPATIGQPTGQTPEQFCKANPGATQCTDSGALAEQIGAEITDIEEYCEENPTQFVCTSGEGVDESSSYSDLVEEYVFPTSFESFVSTGFTGPSGSPSCPALPHIVFEPLSVNIDISNYFDFCGLVLDYFKPFVLAIGYLAAIKIVVEAI